MLRGNLKKAVMLRRALRSSSDDQPVPVSSPKCPDALKRHSRW